MMNAPFYQKGVRGYDYKLMAEDFIAQSELWPSKQKACFHAALIFYPGEKPTDETLTQIARDTWKGWVLSIFNTSLSTILIGRTYSFISRLTW